MVMLDTSKQSSIHRTAYIVAIIIIAFILTIFFAHPSQRLSPPYTPEVLQSTPNIPTKTPSPPSPPPPPPILDPDASSSVHGWVVKSAHANVETWHTTSDIARRTKWDTFLEKRANGAIPLDRSYSSVPPHGPDPWGCRLYYNRAYKIFFIRTAKTGSTTILEHILPACVKNSSVLHCFERVADSTMSIEAISQMWMEYTAFTFTRNVFSRAVSQYQYLVHFIKGNETTYNDDYTSSSSSSSSSRLDDDYYYGGSNTSNDDNNTDNDSSSDSAVVCPRIKWDDFCRDPLLVGEACRRDARCCTKKWTHQDWHMRQQTSCFITQRGKWAVDFIGRIEHFDEDMKELFRVINIKRDKSLPPLEYVPQARANYNPNGCVDKVEDDTSSDSGKERKNKNTSRSGRLLRGAFSNIDGNQLSDVLYCDKRKYFIGKHEKCYKTMVNFFAQDFRLLHSNLSVVEGNES